MIKKVLTLLPVAAMFFSLSAQADVTLKDNSEIVGKWKMYAEGVKVDSVDGKGRKEVQVEWEFMPDGTLKTAASDKQGRISDLKIPIKYSVEDGVIKKQKSPGQEKYETCKVVEKTATDMILNCTYFFFFKKI